MSSGGWSSTFGKDDAKESQLSYDDTAFYYFASSVLLCFAIPWTWSVVKNLLFPGKSEIEKSFPAKTKAGSRYHYCQSSAMVDKISQARAEARKCTRSIATLKALNIGCLLLVWALIYIAVVKLGGNQEIRGFDPFAILEVSPGASPAEIKKGYRKLSLIYHPDKNPDDPMAASRFIMITKAYSALTDEVAKRNYEKYGNPDGPQTSKMGIGLPGFLLEKENHIMILCIFFFFLIFAIPMAAICYYQRTKNYAANGVMLETLHFLGYYINDATRVKNMPEMLAASAESRSMIARPTDNTEMKVIGQQVVMHKKQQYNIPIIVKNQFLVWGHMQRLHHLMSPALLEDVNFLLKHSVKITQAMIEIAVMREWFFTAQSMIEFRRCLIQALDVKSSQLLQIPHFTEDVLKHCHRGKDSVSSLTDFLSKDPEKRKGLASMEPNQLADIEAFCQHISDMELKAVIEVEDESEICVGDVATVSVQLTRKNLKEGEAAGPVHAPFFPDPKFEEWWLFLVEGSATSIRIITSERVRDTERVVEEKLRFQVCRPGKHNLVVHAMCDSYVGIDCKAEVNFNAQTEAEVKRDVFVHPEDEDLDLQPTLFQQFMGEFNHDEESEEEDEDSGKAKTHKVTNKQVTKKDSDSDEDDKDKDKAKKEGGDDDDSSSDSSSDSD